MGLRQEVAARGGFSGQAGWFLTALVVFMVVRAVLMAWMPLTDPSEARYGVLAANMARLGDFVEPKLVHDGVWQRFDGKPPLYFQAGAVMCRLLGANAFAVRLPSWLAALGVLAVLYVTVRRLATADAALAAVVLCCSSGYFFLMSGVCITDMLLTLWVTAAVCAYMVFSSAESRREQKMASVVFFASLGAGVMTKGPVALVLGGVPVLAYVCLGRHWGQLRHHAWVVGPAVFLAVVAPWYLLMAARDPEFLEYFFINENVRRFVVSEYGDRYGKGREMFFGASLVWLLVVNLPAMLLFIIPVARGHQCRRVFPAGELRTRPLVALPLFGVLGMTLFWGLTSRVPLAYMLPSVPLAAVLLAVKMDGWRLFERAGMIRVFKAGTVASCGVVSAGLLVATYAGNAVTHQMPGAMLLEVEELRQRHPEWRAAGYYFAGRTPYSAEFYWGGAVRHHGRERPGVSVGRSGDNLLFITRRHEEKLEVPVRRKLLMRSGVWSVYAPEIKERS